MDTTQLENEDEAKYLSEYDTLKIELFLEKLAHENQKLKTLTLAEQLRKKEVDFLKKQSEICLLQAWKAEQPEPKMVSVRTLIDNAIKKVELDKREFLDSLMEKYKISDPNFAFDPESRKIVEEENI